MMMMMVHTASIFYRARVSVGYIHSIQDQITIIPALIDCM